MEMERGQGGVMRLDSEKWEGIFIAIAVIIVLFTPMWDPMISVVLSIAALVSAAIVVLRKGSTGNKQI